MPSVLSRVSATQKYNAATLRQRPVTEISGSLGDLGTLLPLLVALTLRGSISLPATLLFTGFSNILTGVAFGLPLPVQPMKAIAAVALAKGFGMAEMAAAGIAMGVAVGVLSVTGSIRWVEKRIPTPVVKGIMVGAGLSLCISAGKDSLMGGIRWTTPWWGDNAIVAILAALLLLFSQALPRFPYALVVFVIGLLLSIIRIHTSLHRVHFPDRVMKIPILHPSPDTFVNAIFTASLGQLPLTLLNSVIAVTALSKNLLPSRPAPSTTSLGISVAAMNLIAPWFGGMPACHGSGGLAGQYRFGARSGSSVIILGLAKVALGFITLFKGSAVAVVLGEFPRALLGILVIAAGTELARAGVALADADSEGDAEVEDDATLHESRDEVDEQAKRDGWMVLLVTVAGLLTFKNDAVGFVAGMCWYWGIKLTKRWERGGRSGILGRMGLSREQGNGLGERSALLG